MIEIEEAKASIVLSVNHNYKEHSKQEIVSFYDEEQCCYGDFDTTDMDVYEVSNPYFLSDTFVFCKKHFDNVFLIGECELILYIKVNNGKRIEEIGHNFLKRFSCDSYDALLQRKDVRKAEPIHRLLFSLIGNEHWLDGVTPQDKYLK